METILLFIWNLMMAVKRDAAKQTDKSKPACLGIVYSFEAYLIQKQSITPVIPDRPKNKETPPPSIPIEKSPQHNPRTDWQIWCENNRMLFQKSA
jgi:hypothetical protein